MTSILDLKVRCPDLGRVRARLARDPGAEHRRTLADQRDTYFEVPRGWLKLRDHDLVAYHRATDTCEYSIVQVDDPATCRAALAAVLGVRTEVRKRREVWVVGPSTVHLDDVQGLGSFVEVETPAGDPAAHGHARRLLEVDGIGAVGRSYADLLVALG